MRTKLTRRRVSKRVNQWTERETRCEIKTEARSLNAWCHFLDPGAGPALRRADPHLQRAHAQMLCTSSQNEAKRDDNSEQEVTEETEACEPCSLLLNQLAYLFALDRINRWIPSVTFISWKLISSPTGTFSSFM